MLLFAVVAVIFAATQMLFDSDAISGVTTMLTPVIGSVYNQTRRGLLENFNAALVRAGGAAVNPNTVQQSTLRRCITFPAGTPTGSYEVKFNLTQTEDLSDKLLDQNDLLIATGIRIGVAWRETAKPSKFVVDTFANNVTLGATGATVANVTDFQALWNGDFFIKTGNNITRRFNTGMCYCVPQTQQSALTNRNQRDFYDGFYQFTPGYFFFGGGNQIVSVQFDPTGLASFVGTSGFVSLVVELDGILIQNMDPKNAGASVVLNKGYIG